MGQFGGSRVGDGSLVCKLRRGDGEAVDRRRRACTLAFAMPRQQPWADVSDARRSVMRANKGKHTKPEVAVRKLLHMMGYRFRLHRRDLPGTPDVVLPSKRKAIQVHGCFWHQHEGCPRRTVPATRRDYWLPKLARNKQRDVQAQAQLEGLGWQVMTAWECELADTAKLAQRLRQFLGPSARQP